MIRRVLLKGLAGMVAGDGLRRPVNAPRGQGTPVGVQPGVSNAIVIANKVIVFGTGGGVFVYSGTPGPGNPPIVSVGGGTKDPYGNTTGPGVFTQNIEGSIDLFGNVLTFDAAGNTGIGGTIVGISNGLMQLLSGTSVPSGDPQATLELISAASNFEGFPIVVASTLVALVGGGPEFWHGVTPPAGFTGTLRYRMMPDGTVMVQAQLAVAGTVAAGTVSFGTLSAPYVASADTRGPVGCFANNPTTVAELAAIASMRWEATAGGVFQVLAFVGGGAGGVTELDFVAVFPVI